MAPSFPDEPPAHDQRIDMRPLHHVDLCLGGCLRRLDLVHLYLVRPRRPNRVLEGPSAQIKNAESVTSLTDFQLLATTHPTLLYTQTNSNHHYYYSRTNLLRVLNSRTKKLLNMETGVGQRGDAINEGTSKCRLTPIKERAHSSHADPSVPPLRQQRPQLSEEPEPSCLLTHWSPRHAPHSGSPPRGRPGRWGRNVGCARWRLPPRLWGSARAACSQQLDSCRCQQHVLFGDLRNKRG
jgi:hypothetical protein